MLPIGAAFTLAAFIPFILYVDGDSPDRDD